VLGVEADVAGLFSSSLSADGCHPAASCGAGDTQNTRLNQPIWSVGGRLGWAAGTWMPYVTGGWAETQINHRFLAPGGALFDQSTNDQSGFYVGGGVDYAITNRWIIGVEYRHYDFGTDRAVPTTGAGVPVPGDTWDNTTTVDTVSARVSYKFGGWGLEPLK